MSSNKEEPLPKRGLAISRIPWTLLLAVGGIVGVTTVIALNRSEPVVAGQKSPELAHVVPAIEWRCPGVLDFPSVAAPPGVGFVTIGHHLVTADPDVPRFNEELMTLWFEQKPKPGLGELFIGGYAYAISHVPGSDSRFILATNSRSTGESMRWTASIFPLELQLGEDPSWKFGEAMVIESERGFIGSAATVVSPELAVVVGHEVETTGSLQPVAIVLDLGAHKISSRFSVGTPADTVLAVSTTGSGHIAVAGRQKRSSGHVPWIALYDSKGGKLWSKVFLDGHPGAVTGIVAAGKTGFIAVGHTQPLADNPSADIAFLRVDLGGNLDWHYVMASPGHQSTARIARSGDRFLVTANSSASRGKARDGVAMEIDSSGRFVWRIEYGGRGDDYFLGGTVKPNGDVMVSGTTSVDRSNGRSGLLLLLERKDGAAPKATATVKATAREVRSCE